MNPINICSMEYVSPPLLVPSPLIGTSIIYVYPYGSTSTYVQQPLLATIPIRTSQNDFESLSFYENVNKNYPYENQEENNHIQPEKKKNIRNIIPNIARKIMGFISSEDSRNIIMTIFPHLSRSDIMKFYDFTNNIRKSLNFYIGNKDLLRIWYRKCKNPKQAQYCKMIRILSKYFLNNCCVSSVLLSKRMKPSLKKQHLRYRRKIIDILERGPKN